GCQSILAQHQLTFGAPTALNGAKCFNFQDQNGQTVNIYSNEHNSGTPLGIPTFESNVNPLHQIQGPGPVILKVNDIVLTQSIVTRVCGLEHFAEYTPIGHANFKIQVFRIGDGGLGGELHVHASDEEILMPEHGILEQIE